MGYYDDYLEHHGILGQKWGVRRFENKNGHLTAAGKKRYTTDANGDYQKVKKTSSSSKVETSKKKSNGEEETEEKKKGLSDKQKKMIIAGAAVAGTALAAYGGYKLYQLNNKAKEGLSSQYHQKAKDAFSTSNKLMEKGFDLHETGFKSVYRQNAGIEKMGEANKMMSEGVSLMNKSKDLREAGLKLQDKAKSKNFSVKEKVDYLKSQKDNNLSAKKQDATNKLASEASALARSVTMSGPIKTSSKPAQNGGQTRPQSSAQQLKANRVSNNTMSSGSNTISRTMKVSGQTTFNQASKANDDFVNDLLKKNAKTLGL